MAASPSLYRRHRPRTFDDVIGQEHVVRTLRNAVDNGNVHHAYLFVGSRGTGKTSMAKILASALNCAGGPRSDFAADDPAVEAIASGSSVDVVEMDAASNNGVDEIRELREKVGYMPTAGNWKVYILDEAHMLTTQAWNAFLKTLEEPPPNTVFVLATTEANKVLPTVADRCHRFDFRRPTVEELTRALRRASDAENITVGDDAIAMIARAATGSFRDALGTLEQLVTYGGQQVEAEDVQAVLGVADFELLCRAADALADGDRRAVLEVVSELADGGRDMIAFARDLAGHLRNLLVTRTLERPPEALGLTAEQNERLTQQSARLGSERLARSLDLLSEAIAAAKDGADPRLQLELALFKAARPDDDRSPDALLARIEALEQRAGDAVAAPAASAGSIPQATQASASVPTPVSEPSAVAAPAPEPAPVAAPAPEPAPAPSATQNGMAAAATVAAAPEPAPSPPDPEPERKAEPEAEPEVNAAPQVATATAGEAPDVATVAEAWPRVVQALADESPRLGVALEYGKPVRIDGRKLVIGFTESANFARKTAEQPSCRELISKHLGEIAGYPFAVTTEQVAPEDMPDGTDEGTPGNGIDPEALIERLKKEFDAVEKAPDEN